MAKSRYDEASGQVVTGRVALDGLKLKGFERVEHVPKSSYKDSSMCVIVPSREPWLHHRFVERIQGLHWPMNQRRVMFFVSGAEVGKAYSEQIAAILSHPELSTWKYVLTLEDDTLPPADAVPKLIEAMDLGFDVTAGLYFTKGDVNMPQAYGSPEEFARTGVLDFRARDTVEAINSGGIMPVNGTAMGCTLYKMSLFKEFPGPWFVTTHGNTQDLHFAQVLARAGKRQAVHCGVRCAHAEWKTGEYY